jgi:hypothetical protein
LQRKAEGGGHGGRHNKGDEGQHNKDDEGRCDAWHQRDEQVGYM